MSLNPVNANQLAAQSSTDSTNMTDTMSKENDEHSDLANESQLQLNEDSEHHAISKPHTNINVCLKPTEYRITGDTGFRHISDSH